MSELSKRNNTDAKGSSLAKYKFSFHWTINCKKLDLLHKSPVSICSFKFTINSIFLFITLNVKHFPTYFIFVVKSEANKLWQNSFEITKKNFRNIRYVLFFTYLKVIALLLNQSLTLNDNSTNLKLIFKSTMNTALAKTNLLASIRTQMHFDRLRGIATAFNRTTSLMHVEITCRKYTLGYIEYCATFNRLIFNQERCAQNNLWVLISISQPSWRKLSLIVEFIFQVTLLMNSVGIWLHHFFKNYFRLPRLSELWSQKLLGWIITDMLDKVQIGAWVGHE